MNKSNPLVDCSQLTHWLTQCPAPIRIVLLLVLLGMVGTAIGTNLLIFPETDEGNYILKSWWITQGKLPYRDFQEFITPLGHYLTAIPLRLFGIHIIAVKLWVLLAWILSITLTVKIARQWLSPYLSGMLLCFLWLTDTRYLVAQHHLYSGLFSLISTTLLLNHLHTKKKSMLILSGCFAGLTFWITQSTGIFLMASMMAYATTQILLEKKSSRMYCKLWGLYWLLPVLSILGLGASILSLRGIWSDFYRDGVQWLLDGHYQGTTQLGYFVTLPMEWHQYLAPLKDLPELTAQQNLLHKLLFIYSPVLAGHLLVIGLLPIMGVSYGLVQGFQKAREEKDYALLLISYVACALILATMSYSTSMHLVSNGALAFLLGFLAIQSLIERYQFQHKIIPVLLGLLLLANFHATCMIQLLWGKLPNLPSIHHPIIYYGRPERAQTFYRMIQLLETARHKKRSIFVFAQTPQIYLTGDFTPATRHTLVLPKLRSQQELRDIVVELRKNKPLFIVSDQTLKTLSQDPRFKRYTSEELQFPELDQLIQTHYELVAMLDRYIVYQLKNNQRKRAVE